MPTNQKTYTVTRQFTDSSGRQWNKGDDFEGADEKATQEALAQGNIQESQAGQQPQGGQQGSGGQQPKR